MADGVNDGSAAMLGSSNAMRLLDAARLAAVNDADYQTAVAIQKIINERSVNPNREPTMSSDAVDWIDDLTKRFSDKVYSLAFKKCVVDGTYQANLGHAKEAATVVIESACDYFDLPSVSSKKF